jgi:light-regulated signal transduction histidine kinase (bacteriophytochrome)
LVLKEVDMRDLLSHALENLKLSIAQTGAVINIDSLPRVSCAPLEIVQLWQNLVGNAIKYGGDRPMIDISAEANHTEWIFAVRDQGIGIAPHLHQKIFELFKRVHARDYPGTGLGLTICKAIVERHHGRIWVESEEGKGATFRFTLPK